MNLNPSRNFHPLFTSFFTVTFVLFLIFTSGCTKNKKKKSDQSHIIILTGDKNPVKNGESNPNPNQGDILVEASLGDADKLHSYLGSDAPSHDITNQILLPLMDYDADWKLQKKGVKEYTITQRSYFRFLPESGKTASVISNTWKKNLDKYPMIQAMGVEDSGKLLWVHFDHAAPDIHKECGQLIPDESLKKTAWGLFKLRGIFKKERFTPYVTAKELKKRFERLKKRPEGITKVEVVLTPMVKKETLKNRFEDAHAWFSTTEAPQAGFLKGFNFFSYYDFFIAFKEGISLGEQKRIEKILLKRGEAKEIKKPDNLSQVSKLMRAYSIIKEPCLKIYFDHIPDDIENAALPVFEKLPDEKNHFPKVDNFQGEMVSYGKSIEHNPWIDFTIHSGVKFHDGTEWTTKDIAFNYRRLIDPDTDTPYGSDYLEIKKLEVITPYKFRAVYKRPFSPALESWGTHFSIPSHLCNYPYNYNNPLYMNADKKMVRYHRHPIGNGPFKFKSWIPAEKIVIERNPDYFDKKNIPHITNYTYRIIPDRATQLLELKSGTVDKMDLEPDQYLLHKDSTAIKNDFNIYRTIRNSYSFLGYNQLDPEDLSKPNKFFGDVRVRQALAHAVDKNEIIKIVIQGLGKSCTGPFSYASWAYDQTVKSYEYNPEKAGNLLDLAGWKLKDDGIRYKTINGINTPFEFDLLTNQGNNQRKQCAVILKEFFAKVGVVLNLRIVEWAIFLEKYVDVQNFDAIILGWKLTPDPDCFHFFHSSQIGHKRFNFVGYSNKEVDQLILTGRATYNQKRREKIYQKIHRILHRDQVYMFLYTPEEILALHNRFTNIKPGRMGLTYHYIDQWFVPANEVRYAVY